MPQISLLFFSLSLSLTLFSLKTYVLNTSCSAYFFISQLLFGGIVFKNSLKIWTMKTYLSRTFLIAHLSCYNMNLLALGVWGLWDFKCLLVSRDKKSNPLTAIRLIYLRAFAQNPSCFRQEYPKGFIKKGKDAVEGSLLVFWPRVVPMGDTSVFLKVCLQISFHENLFKELRVLIPRLLSLQERSGILYF